MLRLFVATTTAADEGVRGGTLDGDLVRLGPPLVQEAAVGDADRSVIGNLHAFFGQHGMHMGLEPERSATSLAW